MTILPGIAEFERHLIREARLEHRRPYTAVPLLRRLFGKLSLVIGVNGCADAKRSKPFVLVSPKRRSKRSCANGCACCLIASLLGTGKQDTAISFPSCKSNSR
jgi:hypothetical protein